MLYQREGSRERGFSTREQLKGSYSEGEALAIYNEVKKT